MDYALILVCRGGGKCHNLVQKQPQSCQAHHLLHIQSTSEATTDQHAEYDFKGGAGAPCDGRQGFRKSAIKCVEQELPQDELEDDLTLSQNNVKESMEVTPIQHSARTAGKMFKFADASSLDDFIGNDDETFEEEDEDIGIKVEEKKANKDVKEKKDNVKVSKFLRNGKKIEEREAG
ncbi:Uncharacterized protein Fot_00019 [Forsythia ovata]|uniref:Uncharacterized protein n=1 Tax=Forsythia ovata TaxID=205694 RepID=A0ABD1X0R6_9LAMI